ncbi:MAG: AraC family transcriptional regulator, partial [Pseudomonadota bacterium]
MKEYFTNIILLGRQYITTNQVLQESKMSTASVTRIAQRCLDQRLNQGGVVRFEHSNIVLAHSTQPSPIESTVYCPLLCVVLQGKKEVSAGSHKVICPEGNMILVSHQLPVISKITNASSVNPYIAVILPLDREKLRRYYEPINSTIAEDA